MSNLEHQSKDSSEKKSLRLEWILSIIAALTCIIAVIMFAFTNTSNFAEGLMSQWPFPLIYFIEISAIGVISILSMGIIQRQGKSEWSAVFWIFSGMLLSFVILGAWTIGFFLLPAMIIFLLVGIRIDKKTGNDIPRHLIYFVAGGIAQALLVFLTLI